MNDGSRSNSLRRWAALGGALLLFVVGIQLLRISTADLAPTLETFFARYVDGPIASLGFSWLASYVLTNGSVVAALTLTLFEQDLLSGPALFTAIAGTRLGAPGIVIVIGALDFFFREGQSLEESCSMGLLTLVVTHAVTLPATGLGYLWSRNPPIRFTRSLELGGGSFALPTDVGGAIQWVVDAGGGLVGAILGIAALLTSLRLFDGVLGSLDLAALRERYLPVVRNRWLAFAIGLGATTLTTSVTFSLGLLVPVYNRGHIADGELIPYIMGANIGTLADTVVIALLMQPSGGLEMTLVLVASLAATTAVLLVVYAPVERAIRALHDWTTQTTRRFLLFLVSIVAAPGIAISVGFLAG